MHELSLAESLLLIIEDAAREQRFSRVKVVWLEIGQLACVEQQSLQFYFDAITRDSIAHEATLHIIESPGQARCGVCNLLCSVETYHAVCPHCGSYALKIIQGGEMRIKELEVE